MEVFNVAIVGGGPAGASCAACCARAGLRTLVLEREKFPREKVCGDCVNPAAWPVLRRLGVAERVLELPHGKLRCVDFIAIGGGTVSIPLPADAEIAVKRSLFDQLLLKRAGELRADVREGVTISAVSAPDGLTDNWRISSPNESFEARILVAADGRNSTVARLLGLLPRSAKERVALQTHVPLPSDFGERVVLQFLPQGYSGQAPVGNGELNLCLVGKPADMPALRSWAKMKFGVPLDHLWRTITPLRRAALAPAQQRLLLVGDAARVVEPFTGEGISYALSSGELAAKTIISFFAATRLGEGRASARPCAAAAAARSYAAAHRHLYRGRLWVNQLARAAVLSPRLTSALLCAGLLPPPVLRRLTAKIVAAEPPR